MVTAFQLLGSTTLSGANATISVSGLTARRYIIIELYTLETASLIVDLRFNNDSGANYTYRTSTNGAADVTSTLAQTQIVLDATSTTPSYFRMFVINITAQEKLIIAHHIDQNTAGAANAPTRDEITAKWVNTSSQITEVDVVTSTSTFATGTTLTVYGSD
jgi:hypothetical protein